MSVLAAEQGVILADTSPFCRFAENGVCEMLADYLGARLHLTVWVVAELEHRATQPAHRQLEALAKREPPWTANPPITLDDAALRRADALAKGWRRRQQEATGIERDQRANLGEATTIVGALSLGCAVLLDEGKPKKFATNKGLLVLTTEDIVAELAAARVLKQTAAFLIYQRVYGNDRAAFDARVAQAADALEGRAA
jgi:hypothetical protein